MLCASFVCLLIAVANVIAEPLVSPEYQSLQHPGVGTVRCKFPRPLDVCRVRVSDQTTFRDFDAMLDFGRGVKSPGATLRSRGGEVRATARYPGGGLAEGDCGLSLTTESGYLVILVECFGKSEEGDWSRGFGLVTTTFDAVLPTNSSTPRRIVVDPGSNVPVHMTAVGPLRECYVTSPGVGKVVLSPGSTPPFGSRYQSIGAGADAGECGAELTGVQAWDAGVWYWRAYQGTAAAWQAAVVIISEALQEEPALRLPHPTSLHVGGWLNATCRAPPAVPPASLTWLLGGRVVRRDDENNTLPGDVGTTLPWHPQPSIQTLNMQLTEMDFGKRLECWAEHSAGSRSAGYELTMIRPVSAGTPSPSGPRMPTASVSGGNLQSQDVPASRGCPPLSTHSMTVRCTLGRTKVDCGVVVAPLGTLARLACRDGFKPQENHPGTVNTSCTAGGWQPQPVRCSLDCGRRRGGATQLAVGGKEAKVSEFPWHVAVFRKDSNSFMPICGGSLVSLRYVISAAHCFWDETNGVPMNESRYMTAVGKHTFLWTTQDKTEQRRAVKAIHIPAHFAGNAKRLESDIAVLQLSAAVQVTRAVNIVCVDWKTTFQYQQLTANSLGTVPGWGITENNTLSPTLRFVELPYVPFIECRDSVPWDFKNYLTIDKFCGGYRNRTISVCQGDSGGGFAFPAQKLAEVRYFLRGVVSSAPVRGGGASGRLCQAEYMSAFTFLSTYDEWLEGIVFSTTGPEDIL